MLHPSVQHEFSLFENSRWLAPFWNNKWQGHHTLSDSRQKGEENRASRGTLDPPPLIFWRCSFSVETARWLYLACFKRREAVVEGVYSQMSLMADPRVPESLWVQHQKPRCFWTCISGSCRAEGQASLCPGATTQYFRASCVLGCTVQGDQNGSTSRLPRGGIQTEISNRAT